MCKCLFYKLFVFVCFFNIFVGGSIASSTENDTVKKINKNNNELQKQKKSKDSSFFSSFAKKYIVPDENQIFAEDKYAFLFSYGISVDRDRYGNLKEEYNYNPYGGEEFKRNDGFVEYDSRQRKYYEYSWDGSRRHRNVGYASLHYAVPNVFVGVQGRLSIGFMVWNGLNSEYNRRFSALGVEMIQEMIFGSQMLYFTIGLGPSYILPFRYYNRHMNMSSQFNFAIVTNIGHRFKNGVFIEIGLKHYSNGELSRPNCGLNLARITFGYTF